MRVIIISSETPQIAAVLDLIAEHISKDVEVRRLFVGPGADRASVVHELTEFSEDSSSVVVTVTDASNDSLASRLFARHLGEVHWHFDYFIPIVGTGVAQDDNLRLSGISSTSVIDELSHSGMNLFLNERCAIAARDESGLGSEHVGILPLPLLLDVHAWQDRSKPERSNGQGNGQLRVALASPPTFEYRTIQFLRGAVSADPDVSCIWMCEEGERSQILEISKCFPEIPIEVVVGRSPKKWNEILRRSDCAVHLSESPFELFYYYLLQSLASGIDVICSDLYAAREIPESICWKIEPGCEEVKQISSAISSINESLQFDVSRRTSAIEYAKLICDPKVVSSEFVDISKQVCAQQGNCPSNRHRAIQGIMHDLPLVAL